MASKMALLVVLLPYMLGLVLLGGVGRATIDEDRAECADKLVGLATCLPYVGGEAKAPTLDCCTGLKQVVEKSKKCLCVLLKDRNDPNLGLKLNASLALQLPNACHVPTNISRCIDLLHLAPNSSDAKMFEGFTNSNGKTSSTPATSANSTSTSHGSAASGDKSDGGMGKRWQGIEMVFGTLIWFLAPNLVLYV